MKSWMLPAAAFGVPTAIGGLMTGARVTNYSRIKDKEDVPEYEKIIAREGRYTPLGTGLAIGAGLGYGTHKVQKLVKGVVNKVKSTAANAAKTENPEEFLRNMGIHPSMMQDVKFTDI